MVPQPMFVVQKLSLKSTVVNIETENATSALFSSPPSLFFTLSISLSFSFASAIFGLLRPQKKTPFGQMVAIFSSYA